MTTPNPVLKARITELIEMHGGLRAAARHLGCNPGYLSRLMSGGRIRPKATLLEKLNLREIITYERITS